MASAPPTKGIESRFDDNEKRAKLCNFALFVCEHGNKIESFGA